MVKIYATYECDCCRCKSGELTSTKDANKPFPRISYKSSINPDEVIFDLCPSCYEKIGWAFINNLIRSDLKFEQPKANQDEDSHIFYEWVDYTDYWNKSKL